MQVPFLDLGRLHQSIREPLDEAYRRVMDSGWFIMGPELEAFESEFAAYSEVKHCIGVGNGLEALHLLLRANDIVGAGRTKVAGDQRCPGMSSRGADKSIVNGASGET